MVDDPKARNGKPGAHGQFLTVIFPHHQMTILDYNRVVKDLHGRSAETLLSDLKKDFSVEPSSSPMRPAASGEFGMFLAGSWYRLMVKPALIPVNDPIGRLPVTPPPLPAGPAPAAGDAAGPTRA